MTHSSKPNRSSRRLWRRIAGAAVAAGMAAGGAAEAGPNGPLLAWIEVEAEDRFVNFRSMASSASPAQSVYKLTIKKESGGGSSSTSQGGAVYLDPDQGPTALSTVTINLDDNASYTVVLVVRNEDGDEVRAEISSAQSMRL